MTSENILWILTTAGLVAVALLTLLVIGLLRSYADLVKALHDAGIRIEPSDDSPTPTGSFSHTHNGSQASPVTGSTLEGGVRSVAVSGGTGLLLLAFLSSGCGTCMEFWRVLRSEGAIPGLDADVVAITREPAREEPAKLSELAGDKVQVVMSEETWAAYDPPVTPHFVLIDRSTGSIIGEGSSPNPDSLVALLSRAAADSRTVTRRELLGGRPEESR